MLRGVLVLVLLGLAIGGFVYWESRGSARPAANAGAPGGPAPAPLEVSVVEVREQNVPLRPTYLGRTEASQVVEIRARVAGFLEERAVEEGGPVRHDQLLFRIDARPFEAELEVARARLQSARARLERATRQLQRLREAGAGNAVSPAEVDQWEAEQQVAQADVRLEEARAYQAGLDVGYTRITSPIDGVIGRALKDVGSYVQAGAEGLLAVVQQTDPIYVDFSVSEQELLRWQEMIASGKVSVPETDQIPLAVARSDGSMHPHEGRVAFVNPEVERSTGTALVRGVVPNPERTLRPGQFVRVTSLSIERLHAVLVPQAAVMQAPTGASVYVATAEGTAELRPVKLGEWYQDAWIVEDGLRAGDRVVTDRLMQLRPGAPVRPVLAQPPAAGPGRAPQPDQGRRTP